MIERLIEWSIRHRLLVIAAGIALGLGGAIAAWQTPIDAIPDLSENQVIVFTPWLGHGPREIQQRISEPLSERLMVLSRVRVVRASSEFHFSIIHVIFEEGADFASARESVMSSLNRASEFLPEGVAPLTPPDAAATGQIYWYNLEGRGLDLGRLRAIQDQVVGPRLASVPGVAEVGGIGGFTPEYQVEVDPVRQRRHGVSLDAIVDAVRRADGITSGHLVLKGNAEFIVQSDARLGTRADTRGGEPAFDSAQAIRDLEQAVVATSSDGPAGITRLGDVATIALGPGPRRGVLEKDGAEVVGGVVLMRHGENPLEVTRRVKAEVQAIAASLPEGVRIAPFYDRTPLIRGAIATVVGTIAEAVLTASVCILLILLHVRSALVIVLTLPIAALASFAAMRLLAVAGVTQIETNVMSLAGIAISIGVLVDSSIVMVENVMVHLRRRLGDQPVQGDWPRVVAPACREVGRPIFFSILIMLLSFLPVFALGGLEGRMFRPLAFTKTFALIAAAGLAVTFVPALCSILIRGRMCEERESRIVRGVMDVYRPLLALWLDRPAGLVWILAATCVVGLTPIGSRAVLLPILFLGLVAVGWASRSWLGRGGAITSLVILALCAQRWMTPIDREFLTPLNEGMVMDMPITVPRASVSESIDDLKARDMVLCRFPEVAMVVGKVGRADTPTDPAPVDMIETMVELRPRELWPRRKFEPSDLARHAELVLSSLIERGWVVVEPDLAARDRLRHEAAEAVSPLLDTLMREFASLRFREQERDEGDLPNDIDAPDYPNKLASWRDLIRRVDEELIDRAAATASRLLLEELIVRTVVLDPELKEFVIAVRERRSRLPILAPHLSHRTAHHHKETTSANDLALEPHPELDLFAREISEPLSRRLILRRLKQEELTSFGGELDLAVQMPGWTNVWTMPIQNRVDMLSTGVNTSVGVRVLGPRLDDVVGVSEAVAAVLAKHPHAVDVVADPVRGKGYLEVRVDRERAARVGVQVAAVNDVVAAALGGRIATRVGEGRDRSAVRVRLARDFRGDEVAVAGLLVPTIGQPDGRRAGLVRLAEVAEVVVVEGPAVIKSENGLPRNYVRLNVRGQSASDFVEQARAMVAREITLPEGVVIDWVGQFQHERRATRTLMWIVPVVIVLVLAILYWTYRDWWDAVLVLAAVPGAVAGGVFFQWLFGFKFSVNVWIGYLACIGMATSTGIVMLVYLRQAVQRAGGETALSPDQLKAAVLEGAAHRLRPKLLTEATVLLGLAPMLWATGVGSEVIRPMAAPVLGGILVADEVIDLFLPVAFFHVRKRRCLRRRESEPIEAQPAEAGRELADPVNPTMASPGSLR